MPRPQGGAKKRAVQQTVRQREALDLRLQGLSYEDIGAQLGISAKAAYERVVRAMQYEKENLAEATEAVRQQELARLDKLMERVYKRAVALGDPKDVEAVLKIMDRRARYAGIEQAKVQVEAKWEQILSTHLEG